MSRLDALDENQLTAEIAALERDLADMKSGEQRVGSAVSFFASDSGNTYDWQGVLPPGGKVLKVTITAQNMPIMIATVQTRLYVGTTPVLYTGSEFYDDVDNGITPFGAVPKLSTEPGYTVPDLQTRVYAVTLTGDTSRTLSVKFKILAIDAATVTVTEFP